MFNQCNVIILKLGSINSLLIKPTVEYLHFGYNYLSVALVSALLQIFGVEKLFLSISKPAYWHMGYLPWDFYFQKVRSPTSLIFYFSGVSAMVSYGPLKVQEHLLHWDLY